MMMVVSKISKSNHWWLFMYVLEFFLFLIFVFREPSVGTDTINYINDFKYIERAPFNIQFVFYYFQKITTWLFFSNYKLYFSLIGLIVFYFLNRSVRFYSTDPFFTFVLWLCFYYCILLNVLRQASLLVLIYGLFIPLLLKQKRIVFKIAIFLLMFGIHYSAIFFVVIYFLSLRDYSKIVYFLMLLSSYLIGGYVVEISNSIFPFINSFTMAVGLPDYFGEMNMNENLSGNSLLFFNVLSCLFVLSLNRFRENTTFLFLLNVFLIGQCVANVLYFFGPLHRIVFYSQYAFIFLLPYCIMTMPSVLKSVCRLTFLMFAIVYFYIQFYLGNTGEIFN